MKHLFKAIVVAAIGLNAAQVCAATSPPETDCDTLTASLDLDQLDGRKVITACVEALVRYPETARFQFQLARGYSKLGDEQTAIKWYRKAADQGYFAAKIQLRSWQEARLREIFRHMFVLGNCYETTRIIDRDEFVAYLSKVREIAAEVERRYQIDTYLVQRDAERTFHSFAYSTPTPAPWLCNQMRQDLDNVYPEYVRDGQ